MRIVIADGEAKVRFALRVLLQQRPFYQVVAEVDDAHTLLTQIAATHPDLLLLDWKLPGLQAVASLSELRAENPHLFIVVISGRPEYQQAALADGADAFVSKIDPPERLFAAFDHCVCDAQGDV